jgi:osmotically inducible protein OsmC
MAIRNAQAIWEGDLKQGHGTVRLGSGAFEGQYSFQSRFENGTGTNPEELIAAAHAGCFSMALSNGLSQAGFPPTRIQTTANVHLERGPQGFGITRIELSTEATIPQIDDAQFHEQVEKAKQNCPVSKLLAGAQITLDAKLLKS